jgi:hypothetical protein
MENKHPRLITLDSVRKHGMLEVFVEMGLIYKEVVTQPAGTQPDMGIHESD